MDIDEATMLRLACLLSALQLALGAEYLLPGDVVPHHYDLSLLYDVDPATNYSFFGNVDILLQANAKTSKIVLHAKDFDIDQDKVTLTSDGDSIDITKVQLNDTFNLLTIELAKPLEAGKNYTLTIPYSGNLVNGLDGAYISNYVDKKTGNNEHLVTTQFESISARKAFPCFDEPMYKASYKVTIGHHRAYTAIANMPVESSSDNNALESHWPWTAVTKKFKKPQDQFVWDQFGNSVPMSTYLVAWVVSKFEHVVSPADLSKTKFRIWARGDAIEQTEYASTVGPKVLTHFESWFGVPFPLPKQDMVAIPDFAAGAMENWGLITYRETALLYDKEQSSFLNKERVAEVIAHELAHQWFGNLVTMKWWSDLWLNEGFATFVASIGVAAVEPDWKAERAYAVDNLMSVLSLDALESSHPVSVPIDDPKRIAEIFDEISYRKGSSLIRMMTMFLGEDVFRKAINNYLVKYSYHNAEQDDLWAELTAVNQQYGGLSRNVTVKTIMDTWTKQTGYPLVTVTRDYSDGTLSITQKRYLAVGNKASSESQPSWWVPLNVLCQNEVGQKPEPVEWLAADEGLQMGHRYKHGSGTGEWVLFNAEMIAPYRVNYDADNWRLLSKTLNSENYASIPVLSRVQLMTDSLELAWTNVLDYEHALQMVKYLNRETDFLPLSTGLRGLSKIENVIKRSPEFGAFQKFMRGLVSENYERAGGLSKKAILNGDQLNSVKLQVLTSSWACRMKVPGCEENAIELFQRWMSSDTPDEDNPIPLDLRRTVYCVGIYRGSVVEWRFLLERKRHSNVASHSDDILQALACTREIWILNQYLEWAITDGSEVRKQDSIGVISAVTRSTVGYYVARDFIYNRISDIEKRFRGSETRIGRIMRTLLEQFTTQKELEEFEAWAAQHSKVLEGAKLAVKQGIEKARVNIDWITKNKEKVIGLMRLSATNENLLEWWKNFFKNNGGSVAKVFTRTVIMCVIVLLVL
ncbi:aminopeptidase N-like isoform X1 [Cydia splendana]|uniref:aminopeptidase N-like isoform X1 n=2 Tax=Cydia splendana TaxID=1100963 RepID=UPI00300CAC3F